MNNVLTKFLSWGIATKLVVLFAIFGILPMAAVGYLGNSATGEMETAAGLRHGGHGRLTDRNLRRRAGGARDRCQRGSTHR